MKIFASFIQNIETFYHARNFFLRRFTLNKNFNLYFSRWIYNNSMLLLTNCEVHTGKYLDRSFEFVSLYEKLRSKYFPYGPN